MTHWPGIHSQVESSQTAAQRLSSTSVSCCRVHVFWLNLNLVATQQKRKTVMPLTKYLI